MRHVIALAALLTLATAGSVAQTSREPSRDEMLAAMKRATTFMTGKVAYKADTCGTTCPICRAGGGKWKRDRP